MVSDSPVTHNPLLRSDLSGHGQSDVPRSDVASTVRCSEVSVGSHPSREHPTPKEGSMRSPSKDTSTTSGKECNLMSFLTTPPRRRLFDERRVGLPKPARGINTPDSTIDELTTQDIGELVQVIESTEEFLQIIT